MTILVTGVTGLVGARLLARFVEAGLACRALVRPGKSVPAGADVAEGDLFDPESLAAAVQGASAIVHLAAVFRTPDADLIWKANLEGTQNLIEAAKVHAPEARFIMASTSNVYDAETPHPGREDDEVHPKQAYPASKVAAEAVLRRSGLTWSILRFAFVYGDRDGHLESLPEHVLKGGWHPAHKLSLVHHRDVAAAARLALTGAMDGHIVNLTDDAPTSVYELVALAGASMPPSAEPLANPWHLHVDGSLARSLGFQPSVRTIHQAAQDGLI
jgi:nucleoside-diphosphate-sugar epimerase